MSSGALCRSQTWSRWWTHERGRVRLFDHLAMRLDHVLGHAGCLERLRVSSPCLCTTHEADGGGRERVRCAVAVGLLADALDLADVSARESSATDDANELRIRRRGLRHLACRHSVTSTNARARARAQARPLGPSLTLTQSDSLANLGQRS